jgi:hypothetical protein
MRLRHLFPALAFVAALASVGATAQQAVQYREADDDQLVVQPFNRSVDQIDDMDVRGPGGEEIGEIDEVLLDATGRPVGVSVEVGGFLGIGEREVIMRFDQLRLEGDRFITNLTREQVEALPRWED